MGSVTTGGQVAMSKTMEFFCDIESSKLHEAVRISTEITKTEDPNILYQKCFQLLKLGGLAAEIPRLVVFGQQSMGKTTLLDLIMGGPIGYSSTDTGTKHPVVIILKPPENETHAAINRDQINDKDISCVFQGKSMQPRDLQEAMKHVMHASATISEEELELQMTVPGSVHAVFVDLPGIKDDSKEGAELTRSVVRNYVKNNPNDLYLLVKKASDDPANWPWSLKEFILASQPRGLGLTPRQTIVVGTRSKEFLIGERNDVRTQAELLDRVGKRAVKDSSGNALPLFLLELFSLSLEAKERLDFSAKRRTMIEAVSSSRTFLLESVKHDFEFSGNRIQQQLLNHFDANLFMRELNSKFQALLSSQLDILERRLLKKRQDLLIEIKAIEDELTDQGPQSYRELIKKFLRELVSLVSQMVTGDFMILRLPNNGEEFLEEWGGTLVDNLKEGHQLATDIFPNAHYDTDYLRGLEERTEQLIVDEMEKSSENQSREIEQSELFSYFTCDRPFPDGTHVYRPGQFARLTVSKDDSQMLGYLNQTSVQPLNKNPDDKSKRPEPKQTLMTFHYRTSPGLPDPGTQQQSNPTFVGSPPIAPSAGIEHSQQRSVDRNRIELVVPMMYVLSTTNLPSAGYPVWRKIYRQDGWVGLEPVAIKEFKEVVPEMNPYNGAAPYKPLSNLPEVSLLKAQEAAGKLSLPATIHRGIVEVHTIDSTEANSVLKKLQNKVGEVDKSVGLESRNLKFDTSKSIQVDIMDLYIDSDVLIRHGALNGGGMSWQRLSPLQRIAGDLAETKLLNQLSITHLGRWLKFHMIRMEPTKRYPPNVLLQLMRSVSRVVDSQSWEPLIADLLQANISDNVLQITKLAACATAIALKRILKAALAEMQRQCEAGELSRSLIFLMRTPSFMSELESHLDKYCRTRAKVCAEKMEEMVFEQTYAIQFEMIEDLFDACRSFERDILGSDTMQAIPKQIRDSLANRKAKWSGGSDLYGKRLAKDMSQDIIYEEVRVQFWVCKLLLAVPLTTKLYIHFVKDIKDRSSHLAEDPQKNQSGMTCESAIERELHNALLCSMTSSGNSLPRTDQELQLHFSFKRNTEEIKERLHACKRAAEYCALALGVVRRLRAQMTAKTGGGGGVNFLVKMDAIGSDITDNSKKDSARKLDGNSGTSTATSTPGTLMPNPVKRQLPGTGTVSRSQQRGDPNTEGMPRQNV